MATITERVEAGARYLDETYPGWVDRIDLDRLDLGSDCGCILGQLHGNFWKAPEVVVCARTLAPVGDRGFYLPDAVFDEEYDEEYKELTEAWGDLIRDRRERGAVEA